MNLFYEMVLTFCSGALAAGLRNVALVRQLVVARLAAPNRLALAVLLVARRAPNRRRESRRHRLVELGAILRNRLRPTGPID